MMRLRKAFWIVAVVLVLNFFGVIEGRSMEDGKESGKAEKKFEEDVIKTDTGDLKITFIEIGRAHV